MAWFERRRAAAAAWQVQLTDTVSDIKQLQFMSVLLLVVHLLADVYLA